MKLSFHPPRRVSTERQRWSIPGLAAVVILSVPWRRVSRSSSHLSPTQGSGLHPHSVTKDDSLASQGTLLRMYGKRLCCGAMSSRFSVWTAVPTTNATTDPSTYIIAGSYTREQRTVSLQKTAQESCVEIHQPNSVPRGHGG
jgi:hypothetical protein